jgi:putative phosphoribosyl transferase
MASSVKRFKNRLQAGELLARRLTAYKRGADVVVLALPRGGVPIGLAVATRLEVPLDIMLVRKLGVPGREEFAMGAIASGGLCVLKAEVVQMFDIPSDVIKAIAQREQHEIERRELLYRAGRRAPALQGKTIILVDDGLATGATMLAAVKALRNEHPARVIIAVPVAARESCRELGEEADEIICLRKPEPFYAVGLWYDDFAQVTDAEVKQLLAQADQLFFPIQPAERINAKAEPSLSQQGGRQSG